METAAAANTSGSGGAFHTSVIADEQFYERQHRFHDFLDAPALYTGDLDYKDRLRKLLKQRLYRFTININELRQYSPEMARGLLQEPLEWLPPLEAAVRELAISVGDGLGLDFDLNPMHVGLEGSFGGFHTTPRHLAASFLGTMVCLDGIVTSCSLVRPKMLRSVHYVPGRKAFVMREYWDATMIGGQAPTPINYPSTGPNGEVLTSEFGLSHYRDYQSVTIQELPEKAPAGQLPRSVDVLLEGDLVDLAKPGDRLQVVGVYKSLASVYGGAVPATFRAVLVANAIRSIGRDANLPAILNPDDVQNIKALARRKDIFELLGRSLAPSIYGQEWIKKAVLLQLLGGVEKNLANGTHIRGDINLMLVGDPSTAKSQMLRFVLGLAPLAIATTGRGSSGVGLTAAVTNDKETGERRLEAGAMVLADRGIVCIDEFDKMSDVDRVAIHEVMEQQTVTIAKAGIHASLNARCSVLAAANPIWGQYKETASPQENIRLPDSLLSRFDLLFILLDTSTPEHDRRISSHVLRMHRYTPVGLAEGKPISESALFAEEEEGDEAADEDAASAVFQKHYARSAAKAEGNGEEDEEDAAEQEILALGFVKKYIHYARTRCAPVLTRAASEFIAAAYAEFRQKKEHSEVVQAKTFPVTPRTLETLIRLATAHAKARLSSRVERKDAKVAQELIQYCLYKEVKKKPSKRRKKAEVSPEEEESSSHSSGAEDSTEAVDDEIVIKHRSSTRGKKPAAEDDGKGKEKLAEVHDDNDDMALEHLDPEELEPAMRDLNLIAMTTQATSTDGAGPSGLVHSQTLDADSQSILADSQPALPDSLPFLSQSQSQPAQDEDHSAHLPAVKAALHSLRQRSGDSIAFPDLCQALPETSETAVDAVLKDLEQANVLMYRGGQIYLI